MIADFEDEVVEFKETRTNYSFKHIEKYFSALANEQIYVASKRLGLFWSDSINFGQKNDRSLTEVLTEVLSKKTYEKVLSAVAYLNEYKEITP